MNERIHPILFGIIVLLGAIGVLLSYMLYKATPQDEAVTVSPVSEVETTSTSSENVLQVTQVSEQPVSQPVKMAQEEPMPEPIGRVCYANDLTGKASWSTNGTYLTGTVRIKNSSQTDCVLSKDFSLSMYLDTELVTRKQTSNPSQSILLTPGAEKDIWFSWSNWCGANSSRSAFIRVDLPENQGYLRIPVIDSLGYAQSGYPTCQNRTKDSSIETWWY